MREGDEVLQDGLVGEVDAHGDGVHGGRSVAVCVGTEQGVGGEREDAIIGHNTV